MANTNRTGRVSSVNYPAGTYEVTYFDRGKSVTRTVNAVSNGEYRMPQVGDMVTVSHNSTTQADSTAAGTIWNQRNRPAEGFDGLFRKEYGRKAGRAYQRYDDNSGVMREYTPGGTGRITNGELFDEAKGALGLVAGLAMTLKSIATVGIQGGKGVGINSGGSVTIEAENGISEECTGDRSVVVGGETEETFTGKVERTYNDDVEETHNANTERNQIGDVTEKVTGNVTQNITGNVTQNITGNVSITVGGTVVEIAGSGDVTITTAKASVTATEVTVEAGTGDIRVDGVSLVHHTHKDGGAGEPEKG